MECNKKKLCGNDKCMKCFYKSFAGHEKSKYWSNNNNFLPTSTTKSSNKKAYFNCMVCKHEFMATIKDIVYSNSWCPYCSKSGCKLCENNDCEYCFERSFASHERSKYWSPKNETQPRQVFKNTNKKYIFSCSSCLHDFSATLAHIVTDESWCPYCSTSGCILCDKEDCISCYGRSFASSDKAKYWSKINKPQPRMVFKCSDKEYYFDCNECKKTFKKVLKNINQDSWCPYCKRKSERIFLNWLEKFKNEIIYQAKFDWCKNKLTGRILPFDFYIKDFDLIIEIDGEQHFENVSNWKSPEITQQTDIYKMKLALEKGISVLRINRMILYSKNINWEIIVSKYLLKYNDPSIFYIGIGNEYNVYKNLLQKN